MRIVVLGYIVRYPLAGMTWGQLHYLMGLRELGHDVYFIEDSDDYESCYDPERGVMGVDPTCGVRFAQQVLAHAGLAGRWAYYDGHTGRWLGAPAEHALRWCADADLLLNVCGVNPLRPWLEHIPCKVLVDEDPAFTQVRMLNDPQRLEYAIRHDAFFTFGENAGSPDCRIPDDGIAWRPTRQPVVLARTKAAPPCPEGAFTTVLHWQSERVVEYGGARFAMKDESFPPFVSLPQRCGERFELAITGPKVPHAWLSEHGWMLRDGQQVTASLESYGDYIARSKAEIGIAKLGYVESRGGWFSERSVAYLAQGRPVLHQDTGFGDWLSCGEGIFAFATLEDAIGAAEEIAARYALHCRAAREVAAEYFDSRKVLAQLIDAAFAHA